ncbi:MAG: HAD family hydrolase [Candidatus Hodarchaeales archaeon]
MNAITFNLIGLLTNTPKRSHYQYEMKRREYQIFELLAAKYNITRPQFDKALNNTYSTVEFERKTRHFDYGIARLTNLLLTNLSIVPEYQLRINIEQIFVNILFNLQIQPRKDCINILTTLKREGFKLGLIINTQFSSGDVYRELIVNNLGFGTLFDAMVFSNEVGFLKPHKLIFQVAQMELGINNPSDIVHIGNEPENDIAGALRSNFKAIYFDNEENAPPSVFTDGCSPEYIINSLDEIPTTIKKIKW